MANYNKGRGQSRSRTTGNYTGFSWGANNWGGSTTNSRGTTARRTTKTGAAGSTAYKTVCNNLERKIDSYRTLFQHAQGARGNCPTPATINSFCNWVNKGAIVQTCTPAQVWRWSRSTNYSFNPSNPSPMTCKKVLAAKFGRTCIKAVAKTKGGQFMVATTPTVNGRTFNFPS